MSAHRPFLRFVPFLTLVLACGCTSNRDVAANGRGDDRGDQAAASDMPLRRRNATEPAISNSAGGDELARTALAVPTGNLKTSVLLVEKLAPGEARLNRPYDYRIRVTNLTDTPLTGVVVRERVPENFSVTKSEPSGKDENGWQNYSVGELPAMAARTIDVSGVAKAEGRLDTCIAVDYKPTLCAVTQVVNPILKLTKEGPADADICEGIRYRYVVSNVGTGTEKDVTIEDVLAEGVTTDDGKKTVSLRVGDLPQSTSREFTVRVKAGGTGKYASAAVARAPGAEHVKSQEISTIVHQPKLDVTADGPATEYLTKTAAYTVRVANTGDAPARHTTLGFDVGAAGEVTSVAVTGGKAEGQATTYRKEGVDLGTIAPGESRTITATVRAAREGAVRLAATAVANCVSPTTAKVQTTILTLPALRLEVVDLDDPIRVGKDVVYRISVKNQGTGADHNVTIIATLPAELELVAASGATEGHADGQTVTFAPVESLASGKEAVWQIQAKAKSPGDVRLQVQLKSNSLTKPAAETEPTRLY